MHRSHQRLNVTDVNVHMAQSSAESLPACMCQWRSNGSRNFYHGLDIALSTKSILRLRIDFHILPNLHLRLKSSSPLPASLFVFYSSYYPSIYALLCDISIVPRRLHLYHSFCTYQVPSQLQMNVHISPQFKAQVNLPSHMLTSLVPFPYSHPSVYNLLCDESIRHLRPPHTIHTHAYKRIPTSYRT